MKDRLDTLFEPYVIKILQTLDKPKRFNELMKTIKNRRTLSLKLTKLRKLGLVSTTGMVVDGKYLNGYVISDKGRKILRILDKV